VVNSYDKAGRLVSKTFSDNSRDSRATLCSYEYDKLDRRIKAEVNGVKWVYGYDKLNQLTSASSSDGYVYGYGFDKIGNRMFASLMDKGAEKFKTDFEYNGLNQIASQGFEYDRYGNLTKAKGTEYSYDLQNRLCEVRKSDGTVVRYGYDALGQRIRSEEITDDKTKTTTFLMSGMVEQARSEISNLKSTITFHTLGLDLAGSLTATGGVGAVLSSTSFTDALCLLPNASFNYLYDGNGNVIATCDASGAIKDTVTYLPFGEKISGTDLPFSFSTKPVDASGLSYYGFRFYNAELGRWMSRDPIEEKGGVNLYAIAINNTINRTDRLGKSLIYGPDDNVDENDSCCLILADTWKGSGYASPADCEAACRSAYLDGLWDWLSLATGVGSGSAFIAENPLLAKALLVAGVAIGGFGVGIDRGCEIACELNQCTSQAPPSKYCYKGWFGNSWRWSCPAYTDLRD
jgi:RHS repeat-associated protein